MRIARWTTSTDQRTATSAARYPALRRADLHRCAIAHVALGASRSMALRTLAWSSTIREVRQRYRHQSSSLAAARASHSRAQRRPESWRRNSRCLGELWTTVDGDVLHGARSGWFDRLVSRGRACVGARRCCTSPRLQRRHPAAPDLAVGAGRTRCRSARARTGCSRSAGRRQLRLGSPGMRIARGNGAAATHYGRPTSTSTGRCAASAAPVGVDCGNGRHCDGCSGAQ